MIFRIFGPIDFENKDQALEERLKDDFKELLHIKITTSVNQCPDEKKIKMKIKAIFIS
jgi:hypothetical protein